MKPLSRLALFGCLVAALVSCTARSRADTPSTGIEVTYDASRLRAPLRGLLYRPPGDGPFPTILYSHGSAPGSLNTQAFDAIGAAFVARGWAMFAPYRRGQGLSAAAGDYIGDEIAAARRAGGAAGADQTVVRLLGGEHLGDQDAAFRWLLAQPFVDRGRVALAGNSFGGVLTVLGSSGPGFCAAIDLAGGAESWNDAPNLRATMIAAARQGRTPILFIQAENDYDTAPSRTLVAQAQAAGRRAEMRIYPAFGSSARDGHAFAYRAVDRWHPGAVSFLEANCRRNVVRLAAAAQPIGWFR